MSGVVHIPWYATLFRSDKLAGPLGDVAALALRYGASEYSLHRSRDDEHRFLQLAHFEAKLDWERYWSGPEFVEFRVRYSSWYQVPVLYVWHDLVAHGALNGDSQPEAVREAAAAGEAAAG